jgi:hypothetical protein
VWLRACSPEHREQAFHRRHTRRAPPHPPSHVCPKPGGDTLPRLSRIKLAHTGHEIGHIPPNYVLGLWLQQGVREDMAWAKAIDFYALSCGSFRKTA